MTCIVGLEHAGKVWIGGDAAGTAPETFEVRERKGAKVFRVGRPGKAGYIIGYTTSFRMGDLLHFALKPPMPPTDPDRLDAFMATRFVDAVRACLKEGGFAKADGPEEGGQFLVGVRGRLYAVEADYSIGRNSLGYDAVGSGSDVAMGAMFALSSSGKLDPGKALTCALDAAARLNASVRPPFTLLCA